MAAADKLTSIDDQSAYAEPRSSNSSVPNFALNFAMANPLVSWGRFLFCCLACVLTGFVAHAQSMPARFFPYPYTIDDQPNGLRLVTVPNDNDNPNLVALYIVE